jgi:monoamine oxidase
VSVDVVVVGAGLAGLQTARLLRAGGASVVVLEARDRVGGRTLSRRIGQGMFDLGGQWIGPTQDRLEKLAEELGAARFRQRHDGRKLMEIAGKVRSYRGAIPSLSLPNLAMLQLALWQADREARRVPPEDPLLAPRARVLDRMTLEQFKRRRVFGSAVRASLDVAVRVVFGAEPAELSLLHFLFYLHSGGGLLRLVEIEAGAQERRFVDGAQSLSLRMAAQLGDAVVTGAPVDAIEQDADGVTVRAGDRSWRGRHAVVAVPPALTERIRWTPDLPAARARVARDWRMGATTKVIATYDHAFWRDAGLSAESISSDGPVTCTFDATTHDGLQPALVAFVVGQAARDLGRQPPAERRRMVLAHLQRLFGKHAADPLTYTEQDWQAEPWTGGCPVANPGPGGWSAAGAALRAPFARVHWAGTETATHWCGYMEGALQSAERAAAEVAARL